MFYSCLPSYQNTRRILIIPKFLKVEITRQEIDWVINYQINFFRIISERIWKYRILNIGEFFWKITVLKILKEISG